MRTTSHLLVALTLIFTLFAAALPAIAQENPTTLQYGQSITGEISSASIVQIYTFEGHAGDVVALSMTALAEGLDSYLELLLPDTTQGFTDDDSGGSMNALIGPIELPQDGTYTLRATRFMGMDGTSLGAYELRIEEVNTIPLTMLESLTIDLNDDVPHGFLSLAGQDEGVYRIMAENLSGNTGARVDIRNAQNAYVNQIFVQPESSLFLDPLIAPADKAMHFVVSRQNLDGSLVSGQDAHIRLTLTPVTLEPIAFDTTATSTLDEANPVAHYKFEGHQGDILRLVGRQDGSAGISLTLFGPDGVSITGNASSGESSEFTLDPVVLTQNGRHIIAVQRQDDTGMGAIGISASFSVTLSQTAAPVLVPGEAVTGSFDGSSLVRLYRFDGTQGQVVRFTLSSENALYGPMLDVQGPTFPVLTGPLSNGMVEAPTNMQLISASSPLASTISYEAALPAGGSYLVFIYNSLDYVDTNHDGAYRLLYEVIR